MRIFYFSISIFFIFSIFLSSFSGLFRDVLKYTKCSNSISHFTYNWIDEIRILRHVYIRYAIASDAQAAMIYVFDNIRKSFGIPITVHTSIL